MHPIEHFCCTNLKCPDHGIRCEGKRIRVVYCRTCSAHFSERKGTIK